MENHEKIWNTWKYNCNKKIVYKYKYLVKYRRYRAYISFYLMSQTRWQPCTHPIPFCCTSCRRTMHTNWSTMSIKTPNLKYFPSEPNSYLNKQSTKKGTVIQLYVLSHEDQFTSSTSMAAFLHAPWLFLVPKCWWCRWLKLRERLRWTPPELL